ncbi:hypothetical protein K491DRAFT_719327 [Lophiostoma macrostomum CBS 122681]|uniref:Uncharacterized protein n=1 Tax=Lophiostoma macrostomum CBS 122681 TaxID=1314788 RepID=A0A6A6T0C8_9PLEO|nr:hypothetical protein K491DRAFT_719327 [Lophiostoma macrostomum CBS 122681]
MAPRKTPGSVNLMIDKNPTLTIYNVPKDALLHYSTVARSQYEQNPAAPTIQLPAGCSQGSVHALAQWMQEVVSANDLHHPLRTPDSLETLLDLYTTAIHMGIIPDLECQIEAAIENAVTSRPTTRNELLAIEMFATEYYELHENDPTHDFYTMMVKTLGYRLYNNLVPDRDACVDFINRSCPQLAAAIHDSIVHGATRYPLRSSVSFQGQRGLVCEPAPQAPRGRFNKRYLLRRKPAKTQFP